MSSILKALKRIEVQSSRSDSFFSMPKTSDTKQTNHSKARRRWFPPSLMTVSLVLLVIAIAAIILFVAVILIMNVMLVTVSQRTNEIGLLKSLGASSRAILNLILIEAMLLSALGAVAGLILGQLGSWGIRYAFPQLPAYSPAWAIIASVLVALITGALFSLLPARKAARLDPVIALAKR